MNKLSIQLNESSFSPEAQTTLVSELKGALQRSLTLPESTEKHAKIQALTNLISTVIEACPTPGQAPNQARQSLTYFLCISSNMY